MDEERIEQALRAGPPDERPHRQGALARGLADRERQATEGATFRVRLRPQSAPTGMLLLAAAVGIAMLALVIGVVGTSPGPRPTAVPTASPTQPAVGAPTKLVDRWVGPTRTIPGLAKPATRTILDIQGAAFRVYAGPDQPADLFSAAVNAPAADELRLTASSPTEGCAPFDEGTYRWSLSPGGTTLTLSLINDVCAARAAILPGSWIHTACREATRDCLGPLEAGTYRSTDLDLFHSGHAGQLTYTVPDGWANTIDHEVNYAIRPSAEYLADPGADGNDTVGGVYLFAGSIAVEQPADCSAVPATGVSASAEAIAEHIASLGGLMVVDRGSTVIDGRQARVLDVNLDAAYRTPCPWSGGEPFRSLIMFADLGRDGGVLGVAPGERARILFVDVGPGRVASIWIDGDAATFDERVRDATAIVESLQFQDPAPSP